MDPRSLRLSGTTLKLLQNCSESGRMLCKKSPQFSLQLMKFSASARISAVTGVTLDRDPGCVAICYSAQENPHAAALGGTASDAAPFLARSMQPRHRRLGLWNQ